MRATCILLLCFVVVGKAEEKVSNLSSSCMRCLCSLYGCDTERGCAAGSCGPFYIHELYWVEAGRPTLTDDDDPLSVEAFERCASDYLCSVKTVKKYLIKHAQDCNDDGVTNCYDFMMIHYNGGGSDRCNAPLDRTADGVRMLEIYNKCRF